MSLATKRKIIRHDEFLLRDAVAGHLAAAAAAAASSSSSSGVRVSGPARAFVHYVRRIRALTELVRQRCKFDYVPDELLESLATARLLGADILEIDAIDGKTRLMYQWVGVQLGLVVALREKKTQGTREDLVDTNYDMRFTGISTMEIGDKAYMWTPPLATAHE